MLYQFMKNALQSRKMHYEWQKRAATAQPGRCVEIMQMRANLEISLTHGSLALPLPPLLTLLRCITHVCRIVEARLHPKFNLHYRQPRFAPGRTHLQTMAGSNSGRNWVRSIYIGKLGANVGRTWGETGLVFAV